MWYLLRIYIYPMIKIDYLLNAGSLDIEGIFTWLKNMLE